MKKNTHRYFLLLAFAGLFLGLLSCNTKYKAMLTSHDGINFNVISLVQAKQLAKDENKPLFVFAHASWCPTCKRMENEVLNQKALGDSYNKEVVNVAIDIDSPDGKQLGKQFPIRATPTLLFFNPDGSVARKIEGYTGAGDLLLVENQLRH
ncbi:MAG TPA: thioredoxin family protein [Puia sp.]|uniref:thioredoxin family protein n=1 Tax=Puia sp. TaxID=2045100 RepID=UPI002CCEFE3B|nr:thioredoxin family protein [Puia sp.]HVU96073.1 thioredoxin family protein [Puia sp.]